MSSPGDDIGDTRSSPGENPGRIRVSIACQHCRLRKIKCDGEVPCKKCIESGIICQPGAKRKKRAPSRKDQYIRELEKKIQSLEGLQLRQVSPQSQERQRDRHSNAEAHGARERSVLLNGAPYKKDTNQLDESQYFGASSSLGSIEVETPRQHHTSSSIRDHVSRSESLPQFQDAEHPIIIGHHAYDDDLDTNLQVVQAQLPSPEVIQHYIDKYFIYFAVRCPVLNESDFRSRAMVLMQEQSTESVPDSFISVFLMVLCLGEYFSSGDEGPENVRLVAGWKYFLSSYSNVREGLRRMNLDFMQATVLQIIFLQAISKIAVAYILLGTLIRLMQAAGIHRAQDMSTPEGIVKTNLMNIVYVQEKQLALVLGRPSLIQDFDCDFFTPTAPSPKDNPGPYGAYAGQVHLARIAGQIQKLLYSAEAARTSASAYLRNVEICEAELEQWRRLYIPLFPVGGHFDHQCDIPREALENKFQRGIPSNFITYLYLLCHAKRAIPFSHQLPDGRSTPGIDPEAVGIAMAMTRLTVMNKQQIEPTAWLSIYKAFTAAAIIYQSLKTKARLKSLTNSPSQIIETARVQEIATLRVLESIMQTEVRGYIGASKYLAGILRTWIAQFENIFGEDGGEPNTANSINPSLQPSAEGLGPYHFSPVVDMSQVSPMGMAFAYRNQFTDQWTPIDAQQMFPMFQQDPMTEYVPPPFQGVYSMPEQMDLTLTTATTDFQGTYNWQPPQNWLPDPPSAAIEGTDFSGADMFNLESGYQNFEVSDLLLPPWMVAQGMPDH
ncbi:hypothetical protein NA57DRAFT_70901 [Rhizodiscina lignyota]|uniref:Zn(2)-C6 fungal-type domain-containing protein n=1 Tax=Rhizodiscina lignyota TaxID=1504668 RepID=A0A9P4ISS2_9PEZI|nr:hypothetical protein NA57DRAFT_70901 [Rhizodiscina lignyota]